MEGITIYNGTIFRIKFSIFKAKTSTPIESGSLEPHVQNDRIKGWTGGTYNPGKYRIESRIEDVENGTFLKTFVNVDVPIDPIEIKADENGGFWWKIHRNKS